MLREYFQSPTYYISFILVIGIYVSFFVNNLPKEYLSFTNNITFRLLIVFIIFINAQYNPMVAIALLIGWTMTLDQAYLNESFNAINILLR